MAFPGIFGVITIGLCVWHNNVVVLNLLGSRGSLEIFIKVMSLLRGKLKSHFLNNTKKIKSSDK